MTITNNIRDNNKNIHHVIWSNLNMHLDDWRDDIEEIWKNNNVDPSTKSEEDYYDEMYRINNDCLDTERCNLNIPTEGRIILIADLGFWNGRRMGYRILNVHNVNACLNFEKDCEDAEWWVDRYNNLRSTQYHHDGYHNILYREVKPEITSDQLDVFCWKIYNRESTSRDITKYTRSLGKRIKNVYGW